MSPTMITIGKVTIINNYRYTNTTCKIHPYQKAQVQCVDYKFGKIMRVMIPSFRVLDQKSGGLTEYLCQSFPWYSAMLTDP